MSLGSFYMLRYGANLKIQNKKKYFADRALEHDLREILQLAHVGNMLKWMMIVIIRVSTRRVFIVTIGLFWITVGTTFQLDLVPIN